MTNGPSTYSINTAAISHLVDHFSFPKIIYKRPYDPPSLSLETGDAQIGGFFFLN
jgi:hypothetical protein